MQLLRGNFLNSSGARKGFMGMLLIRCFKWVCLLLQSNVVLPQLWEFYTTSSLPIRFDRYISFIDNTEFHEEKKEKRKTKSSYLRSNETCFIGIEFHDVLFFFWEYTKVLSLQKLLITKLLEFYLSLSLFFLTIISL